MAGKPTLVSTTLEQNLLELIALIRIKQEDTNKNPNQVSFIDTSSYNALTGTYTINLEIPATETPDPTDGSLNIVADVVYLD